MGPVEKALRAAGKRITPPGTICTGAVAKDCNGDPVTPRSKTAVQWCALGALENPDGNVFMGSAMLLRSTAQRLGYIGAADANDSTGGTITPDLYSEAIEAAAELGL